MQTLNVCSKMNEEQERSAKWEDLVTKRNGKSVVWKYFSNRNYDADQKQSLSCQHHKVL